MKVPKVDSKQHVEERLASIKVSLTNATMSRLRVIAGAAPMLHLPMVQRTSYYGFEPQDHHQQDHHHHQQQEKRRRQQTHSSPSESYFLVSRAEWVEVLMEQLINLVWFTRDTPAQVWCVDALRLLVDAIKRTNDIVADQAKVVGSGPTFSHESVRVASLPLAQISCLLERDKMLHSRLLRCS